MNGGATWSSWYNQPTAQLYHVDHHEHLSLSRLRRAAGERLGVHFEPRQRRRDHVPRLASGRRDRVRLRRARSARSRHHLRRRPKRGFEVPLVDRRRCRTLRPIPVRDAKYRTDRTEPIIFSRRSIRTLSITRPMCCSRRPMAGSPGRPSAPTSRARIRAFRRVWARYSTKACREAARRDLRARSVVQEHQHALGRHRRRPDLDHARRRQELEGHHAAGT